MESLIKRKMRGFKFEDGGSSDMDIHIGEIGTITYVKHGYVYVKFKDRSFVYPLDQIEPHLVSEDQTQEAIELLESKGYKVTKEIPIGATCLFSDDEYAFKNNIGLASTFQGMEGDKFKSSRATWKFCKQVTITDV